MKPEATEDPVTITDEELRSLTDAIQQRHGIDFSCYEPKSLKRRIVRVLHRFDLRTVHELWMKILRDYSFIYPFMDEISVGLTAMFRDPEVWRKMRTLLQGNLGQQKPTLSLWHAGCSSGEEVYTMGIVLRESGIDARISGCASDISHQAIELARKGEYHMMKLQEYQQNYLEYNPRGTFSSYFICDNGSERLDPSLVSHITFNYHNLITSPFTKKFDIIFCRNVMIYFDNHAKQKLFNKFYDALNEGGLLVIGFYDAVMPLIDPTRFTVLDLQSKIFQKV
jgi:chemotaxis protein methyltransferase CheR